MTVRLSKDDPKQGQCVNEQGQDCIQTMLNHQPAGANKTAPRVSSPPRCAGGFAARRAAGARRAASPRRETRARRPRRALAGHSVCGGIVGRTATTPEEGLTLTVPTLEAATPAEAVRMSAAATRSFPD